MHDGPDVVLDVARGHFVPWVLIEVVFQAGLDILVVHSDVVVAVGSWLFVVEADCMPDLVSDDSQLKKKIEQKKKRFS